MADYYRRVRSTLLLVKLLMLLVLLSSVTEGVIQCSPERGAGYCPSGNTCCFYRVHYHTTTSNNDNTSHTIDTKNTNVSSANAYGTSACIPNDLGSDYATCCYDYYNHANITKIIRNDILRIDTGCPMGYTCSKDSRISNNTKPICLATHDIFNDVDIQSRKIDPLLMVMPSYPMYPCPQIEYLYGFTSVSNTTTTTGFTKSNSSTKKLAYFSSHGTIQPSEYEDREWMFNIDKVIIVIHGANRNADDYFCTMNAIIAQEFKSEPFVIDQTLLLAPWFLSSTDDDPDVKFHNEEGKPYRWNTSNDASGPWRYGADADHDTNDPIHEYSPSSYELIDNIVSYILKERIFQNVMEIYIAGHSSGGQFVQRYSLISPVISDLHRYRRVYMRFIVANPSSYAYLTPLRHWNTMSLSSSSSASNNNDGSWRLPNSDEIQNCPNYNEWEWGIGNLLLDDNVDALLAIIPTSEKNNLTSSTNAITVPTYVQNAMRQYGTIQNLTLQFAERNVIYLAGGLDVCNTPGSLSSTNGGWCNSHGLETSCNDMIQGSNRLERHYWYCTSLYQVMNISSKHHKCFIVNNVGHDHSLMFGSEMGAKALFYGFSLKSESINHLNDVDNSFIVKSDIL